MKPFDVREFAKQFKLGKGTIKTRKDVEGYIKYGYDPKRLLMHFVVDNDSLQYILAEIEMSKLKIN